MVRSWTLAFGDYFEHLPNHRANAQKGQAALNYYRDLAGRSSAQRGQMN
jgi:hypothetical protein